MQRYKKSMESVLRSAVNFQLLFMNCITKSISYYNDIDFVIC